MTWRLWGLCVVQLTLAHAALAAEYAWWEAERPTASNFREHSWVKMQPQERTGLSGGDWLTLMHKPEHNPPDGGYYFARYRVQASHTSRYHLWSRQWAFTQLPAEWRFDDQPWHEAGLELPSENRTTLADDRLAAWFRYGEVELTAGEHSFEIRLAAKPGIAAFDCFLLYRGRFQPAGKQKPVADAAEFYQYPEQERVETIVRAHRAEADAIVRVKEEARRSRADYVDFNHVGREVDAVRFGKAYSAEMAAHHATIEGGNLSEQYGGIGERGCVQWEFAVPEAGPYVLTFCCTGRPPDRIARLSVELSGRWKEFGIMDADEDYQTALELPRGTTRFRVTGGPKGGVYFGGARLSRPRGNPWQNFNAGLHPRLLFTPDEIARIQRVIAADPNHPARYFYDSLLKDARDHVAKPHPVVGARDMSSDPLAGSRDSSESLNVVAMAYALTGRKEFAQRGAEYLERLSRRDFGRKTDSVLGNGEYLQSVAWAALSEKRS
ncbi:MAG: hypothetical protein ABSG68_27215 [Thermoguttaceae bacterium]